MSAERAYPELEGRVVVVPLQRDLVEHPAGVHVPLADGHALADD